MTDEAVTPSSAGDQMDAQSEQASVDMVQLEERLDAIQARLGTFVMRSEVDERMQEAALEQRRYADAKVAESETRSIKLVDQINQTLQSINDTITTFNRTINGLNTTVAGLDGQLKHFGAVVNQVTSRQDGQSRAQDQLRTEMREVREDIDKAQETASIHSNLITAQGQMMRDFHGIIYGDGTRESVFGMLREMQVAQQEMTAALARVVQWQDNVNKWLIGGFKRMGEAWAYPPVRMAAAGAAVSGGLALAVEIVGKVIGG